MTNLPSLAARLENYTLKYPQEILLVHTLIDGEEDMVLVFKGFSSSLIRPTAYDPEVPVLPETAVVTSIDQLKSPYQPQSPQYIAQKHFSRIVYR